MLHRGYIQPLASGAGCLVIAGLTTYFFFPETSGIPVETAHTVFKDHWAWPRAYPEILTVSLQSILGSPDASSKLKELLCLHPPATKHLFGCCVWSMLILSRD